MFLIYLMRPIPDPHIQTLKFCYPDLNPLFTDSRFYYLYPNLDSPDILIFEAIPNG